MGRKFKASWLISLIFILTLTVSVYFNFKWQQYKNNQQQNYSIILNRSFNIEIELILQNINYAIESLREHQSEASIVHQLDSLSATLMSAETSFKILDLDFAKQGASAFLMYNVIRDYYTYVQSDLVEEILDGKLDINKDSNEIIFAMEMLKNDITLLHHKFNGTELSQVEPSQLQEEWREAVREIIMRNNDFDLYRRMMIKYGFDGDVGGQ
ncbi:hypothetical protein D3C73_783980 [compost metagenome]